MVPALLPADIGGIIGSLVFLATLVLWVINQIAEGKKQFAKPVAPRPAGGPPVQRPAAQAGPKPPVARELGAERQAAAGGLRGEVEDFLRRAAAQQPGGQAGQANRPAGPRKSQPLPGDKIEVLVDEQGRTIERRRPAELTRPAEPRMPRAPLTARPAAAPPPSATSAGRLTTAPREPLAKRESVAEHVRSHIDSGTRALGQQAAQLGQRIVREDAQFDVQLKAKFDHEVGTLASKERLVEEPPSLVKVGVNSPAAQLAAMLANPEGVRQAVIMNEILRRPGERW
jgi:hypothetical protein